MDPSSLYKFIPGCLFLLILLFIIFLLVQLTRLANEENKGPNATPQNYTDVNRSYTEQYSPEEWKAHGLPDDPTTDAPDPDEKG